MTVTIYWRQTQDKEELEKHEARQAREINRKSGV
jgi:hypothetical protein